MTALEDFDLEGLVRAFSDYRRDKFEYVLDIETGRVHFIPLGVLREAEEGRLQTAGMSPQDAEKAEVARRFIDDLSGRYELVPFVEEESIAEWEREFLAEHGATELTAELKLEWEQYRITLLQDEIQFWLDETGILEEGEESWLDEDLTDDAMNDEDYGEDTES